jgi:hypothetical protein
MVKKYAECNIVIRPEFVAKPTRKRSAGVDIEAQIGMKAGVNVVPIKLVIKGENAPRVLALLKAYSEKDEVLADRARESPFADEVKDMTVEEIGAWSRNNILAELQELAERSGQDRHKPREHR